MQEDLKNKLLGIGLKESDLAEVAVAFDTLVESNVQSRMVEETAKIKKTLSEQADAFVEKRVAMLVEKKTAQLEKIAEDFCNEKAVELAKKADQKINEEVAKVEESASKYIETYFNEAFDEKFKATLQNIEESVISSVDSYLDITIKEKISPDLFKSVAVNETLAPIVEGVQKLFADNFVPLNNSGTAKLDAAKSEITSLEESLKEQVQANVRLATENERFRKQALISESCEGLSATQRNRLKKFFESKPFSTVKSDIDEYKLMLESETAEKAKLIAENADQKRRLDMRREKAPSTLRESRRAPERVSTLRENVENRFKKPVESAEDRFYSRVSSLL